MPTTQIAPLKKSEVDYLEYGDGLTNGDVEASFIAPCIIDNRHIVVCLDDGTYHSERLTDWTPNERTVARLIAKGVR